MKQRGKTKLVVDDTTIYEIDLDCQECMERENLDLISERNFQRQGRLNPPVRYFEQ